jgi:hypothetical protein
LTRMAPDLPLVCKGMLMRRRHIPVVNVIFDVLSVEGVSMMRVPYWSLSLRARAP